MKLVMWNLCLIFVLFVVLTDCANKTQIKGKADYVKTHLLSPAINAYGGRTGQRAVFKCRANLMVDGTIKWYKKASRSSCSVQDTVIDNGDVYCLLNRSKLTVRRNIMVSKLVFKNPRRSNSGVYMCIASSKFNNITQKMKINFHDAKAPPVRIIDSPDGILADGTVEIFYNTSWNRVRFYTLTNEEAHIICKTLGYNFGSEPRFLRLDRPWPYRTKTNKNTKFLSMKCPENAQALLNECRFWYENMNDIAAGKVTCTQRPNEVRNQSKIIRLRGFKRKNKGRVEVLHKGVWGLVYPRWVQFHEADMFCRMLGFKHGGEPILDDSIPSTRGTLWIRNIDCPINASSLEECILVWEYGTYFYDGAKGGGVICRKRPKEIPIIPFRNKINRQGVEKLQYYKDGYWGTVCGAYIGTPEASMICSMMGYRNGGFFKKTMQDYYLTEIGPVLLKNLDCPLRSTDIKQCQFRNYSHEHTACGQYSTYMYRRVVSLICNKKPPKNIPVRLNGSKPNRGVLEVFHEGEWKTASFELDPALASVVCRQLGYRHGGEMYKEDTYMLSDTSDCTGKEENLGHCNELKWIKSWSYTGPLGIFCYENEFPYVVLNTLNENLEGQVILKRNESYYSISTSLWDDIHASAYCTSFGYRYGKPMMFSNENRVRHHNFTMYDNRQIIQKMYCGRGTRDLHDCFHTGWNDEIREENAALSFLSYPIAGVKCFK